MRHEVEQTLCERYPALFAERFGSVEETAMARGTECPDGWFSLLDMLCARLQEATDSGEQPQTLATQVKENFGRLRFRVREGTASNQQRSMIRFAEALSLRTCPLCGALDCTTHAPLETRESFLARRRHGIQGPIHRR